MNTNEQKQNMRQAVKKVSVCLTEEERKKADAVIAKRILSLPQYREAETVFCFVSMPGEIDTTKILEDAFAHGKRVGVPKCISKGVMEVYEITSLEELEESGPYHIREPKGTSEGQSSKEAGLIEPEEIEFAVVPCVSCSSDGKRLGHGGGYYDRYLAKSQAIRAVVCRRAEMREDIPVDTYDLKMDIVITDH